MGRIKGKNTQARRLQVSVMFSETKESARTSFALSKRKENMGSAGFLLSNPLPEMSRKRAFADFYFAEKAFLVQT